jgi:hypothetical protein
VLIDNSFYNNTTFPEWYKIKHGVPKSSVLGHLFFLLYINDLPNIWHEPNNYKSSEFKLYINNIINNLYDWFKVNSLSLIWLNLLFTIHDKNSHDINIIINCDNKQIKVIKNTFLVLDIDSSLSQKNYIDQLMIKLGRACYAIRYIKHCMSQDTLSTIYFSYLLSFLLYGIIFGGNSEQL